MILGVPNSFVKLDLRLTVESDYLHITGTTPCLIGNGNWSALPFTCLNGKPVIFGSSLKGAARSRADLRVPELRPSQNLAGEEKKCYEIKLAEKDWSKLRGRRRFSFKCCDERPLGYLNASWRHLTVWFEEVSRCKRPPYDEDLDTVFGIDKRVRERGKTKNAMLPSRAMFSTFFSDEQVEVVEIYISQSRSFNTQRLVPIEVVTKNTLFEGSVTLQNPDEKSLALLLYSLSLFKKRPSLLLGRFKYKKMRLKDGSLKSFGQVRVELLNVESFNYDIPNKLSDTIEKYKNIFKNMISEDPSFDEIKRLRRVRT